MGSTTIRIRAGTIALCLCAAFACRATEHDKLKEIQALAGPPSEDAVKPLLAFSRDPSPRIRRAVAYALGVTYEMCGCPGHLEANGWVALRNPAVIARLVELAQDPDPLVRRAAIASLVPYKTADAIPAFRRGLQDTDDYQSEGGNRTVTASYALFGLRQVASSHPANLWPYIFRLGGVRTKDPFLIGMVSQYVSEAPPQEVQKAWDDWWPRWREMVAGPNPGERAAAMRIASTVNKKGCFPFAVEALRDPAGEVRAAAIGAVTSLDGTRAQEKTIVELMGDNDPAVRDAAANAIFWWGSRSAHTAAFVNRFNGGARDNITLQCLAASGGPEACAALTKALDDSSSPGLRQRALQAIMGMGGRIGGMAEAADRLYAMWQEPATARDAFFCLLRLGDPRVFGEAEKILKESRKDWTDPQKPDVAEELARKASGETRLLALRWLLEHRKAPDCGALCESALVRLRSDPQIKAVLSSLE